MSEEKDGYMSRECVYDRELPWGTYIITLYVELVCA